MVTDQFGLKQIYRSSALKQKSFALPMQANQVDNTTILQNTRFSSPSLNYITSPATPNIIDYWELSDYSDSTPFLLFLSQNDFLPSADCNLDHSEAADQGFAFSADDYTNVEITGHFFILSRSTTRSFDLLSLTARDGPTGTDSTCCSVTRYGARVQTSEQADKEGLVTLFKQPTKSIFKAFPDASASSAGITTFYQKWFGFKFVVRNVVVGISTEVHVELYLSPSDLPVDFENWVLVYKAVDHDNSNWTNIGTACNSPRPNQPITWGSAFCAILGTQNMNIRFKNVSIREIESPEETTPTPPGGNDPGSGDPTNPPDTEPPDTPTPPTPTIVTKRLTIKREIINNAFCQCDGVPDEGDPGGGGGGDGGGSGGGGGGGGSGSLRTIYNVSPSGAGYAKLASVSKNRDKFYLRYGQIVSQSDSVFIGEKIGRIEVFLAEEDKPRGGTGDGVHLHIRSGTNDSIVVDFGTAREKDLHDAGSWFRFTKIDNTYAMQLNDKILFEYDGGDNNDYAKVFRKSGQPNTGSKTVHRNNNQDPGEYSTSSRDVCMRVFAIAGTLDPDTSDP